MVTATAKAGIETGEALVKGSLPSGDLVVFSGRTIYLSVCLPVCQSVYLILSVCLILPPCSFYTSFNYPIYSGDTSHIYIYTQLYIHIFIFTYIHVYMNIYTHAYIGHKPLFSVVAS